MDSRGKSLGSALLAIAFTLLQLGPIHVASYPIYGTKRFHQGGDSSPALMPFVAPVQIYTPIQTGGAVDQRMDGYLGDDPRSYLYYVPHDPNIHSYGMPVYHGEYKPSPYLYAQAPTYQYYDEKEPSNPLDDLHEEMLEEDEREREEEQQQFIQHHPYGQQKYYQHQQKQQQQQQLLNDDYPDLTKHRNYYQPIYEPPTVKGNRHQKQQQQQQPRNQPQPQQLWQSNMDYDQNIEADDDSDAMLMEPSYVQANAAFLKDLIEYNREINSGKKGHDTNTAHGHLQNRNGPSATTTSQKDYNTNWNFDYPEQEQYAIGQDPYDYDGQQYEYQQQQEQPQYNSAMDDKAVRELQELTHNRDKSSQFSSESGTLRKIDFAAHEKQEKQQQQPNVEDYWMMSDRPAQNKDSELYGNQYEYEDGGDEWINWDSKRSVNKPISIVAFTDRKPASKIMITKVPENHFVLDGGDVTTTTTTSKSASTENSESSSSSEKGPSKTGSSVTTNAKAGQKEIVLMRPAPPVRHPFSAPVLKMLEQQESLKTNKYDSHAAVEDLDNKKRSASGTEMKSANVFDTIKQLLNLKNVSTKE